MKIRRGKAYAGCIGNSFLGGGVLGSKMCISYNPQGDPVYDVSDNLYDVRYNVYDVCGRTSDETDNVYDVRDKMSEKGVPAYNESVPAVNEGVQACREGDFVVFDCFPGSGVPIPSQET